MNNLLAWMKIFLTPGLGPATSRKLVDYFESPEKVLKATENEIRSAPGIKRGITRNLLHRDETHILAEKELNKAADFGVTILPYKDPRYPALLNNIHNPPFLLYVKGNVPCLNNLMIGIVGARASTSYGRDMAFNLASSLARQDITISSGLALGIDSAAHQGAIKSAGTTVAVLGCGLDIVYPPQNNKLYLAIPESGALVSEYPFGTSPDGFRFPARNRIISGMSIGVVVVEAAKKSGSLITAQLALEQGREVFAVPGRVDSAKSEGTHFLLKEGAKLVHSVEDIIEEIRINYLDSTEKMSKITPKPLVDKTMSIEEKELLAFLDVYPKTIDEIIRETNLRAHKVSELLLLLELKNVVRVLPGKQYQLVSTPL
ncbi:MAG: DNA-processing protein DprA [Proteobacteria bacterium]|nr:DNA-processing protein DprA [Pseudomonadota bacterium]MBU1709100.1 DNA-processing protein DprA [Pseudomonadota bacterium]